MVDKTISILALKMVHFVVSFIYGKVRNKMKVFIKLLAMFALGACAVSCSDEEENGQGPRQVPMAFNVTNAGDDFERTLVGEDGLTVEFVEGDLLSVLDGTYNNRFKAAESGVTVTISGKVAEADTYYALYPYQEGASLTEDGNIANVVVPATQTATEGTFDPNAAIAVGKTANQCNFRMKNVCSYIRFNATKDCSYVSFADMAGRAVAGTVTVNPATGEVVTVTETSKKVFLRNVKAGKVYYIAVLPGTTKIRMNFVTEADVDGNQYFYFKYNVSPMEIGRSKVLNVGKIALDGKGNGPVVDLGLPSGTLWATHNLGADAPEAVGNYYQSGDETACNDKDCTEGNYNWNLSGTKVKNAAKKAWGSPWRVPTVDELAELSQECTWEYSATPKGYYVSDKDNSNHRIFLPAGGWRQGTVTYDGQDICCGQYRSNGADVTADGKSWVLGFDCKDNVARHETELQLRYYGCNIRPVYDTNVITVTLSGDVE